ncbi:hypothetical protein GMRT_10758 [Giardia muris]|uniref:Uncharacterized protein n=1 Tax=Giardia muris TaxID=5742 RepID=A0A4Z1SY76_GIAMU|nr:hypothetical protein GMRT_10758 [Giardia muris]|eukprot:TNJ30654.1 hypothetical protein GMRT_10758 [Giardia muris]
MTESSPSSAAATHRINNCIGRMSTLMEGTFAEEEERWSRQDKLRHELRLKHKASTLRRLDLQRRSGQHYTESQVRIATTLPTSQSELPSLVRRSLRNGEYAYHGKNCSVQELRHCRCKMDSSLLDEVQECVHVPIKRPELTQKVTTDDLCRSNAHAVEMLAGLAARTFSPADMQLLISEELKSGAGSTVRAGIRHNTVTEKGSSLRKMAECPLSMSLIRQPAASKNSRTASRPLSVSTFSRSPLCSRGKGETPAGTLSVSLTNFSPGPCDILPSSVGYRDALSLPQMLRCVRLAQEQSLAESTITDDISNPSSTKTHFQPLPIARVCPEKPTVKFSEQGFFRVGVNDARIASPNGTSESHDETVGSNNLSRNAFDLDEDYSDSLDDTL